MAYKHGIYTEEVSTIGALKSKANGTIPVYIGTAPIHTLQSTDNKIATPILIQSYNDFVKQLGYSDDWEKYTLCEVAYAHFKNNIHTIAPFVVINIFDPAKHKADEGNDIDISKITSEDFTAGVKAIDTITIRCGVTPNILVAPHFSDTPDYANMLINKCSSLIGGKLGCVAYIDIPTSTVKTFADAKSYMTSNSIKSKFARVHYPKSKYAGKLFHLSTLNAVATQIVDTETDGVACHSSSNRKIMCDVPALDKDNELIYSEGEANELNAVGITTINYIGGSFRLWGGHMANYNASSIDSVEAKDRSDATVRMQIYLDNTLKTDFVENIDALLTRRDIDNIISNVSIWLNSLVNRGYLLKGECHFDDGDNATAELADGNLVLDVIHTETPNGKAITFQMQYDVSGLETLYAAEEV